MRFCVNLPDTEHASQSCATFIKVCFINQHMDAFTRGNYRYLLFADTECVTKITSWGLHTQKP